MNRSCYKVIFYILSTVFCAGNTFAQTLIIKADPAAPKNTQPIILQTANGIPQVNIQTPNNKGLSHNKYVKFDVDTKGAILNNGRKISKTQLGGYVQANPYLARGEANVILNEVNSNDPSLLKGYIEVAGKKADVIIANPSGIHCSGCGVVNSNRVTITTGKPQIIDGKVDSFTITQGEVQVLGKGLDNSQVDYTEILSHNAKINAGIWGKEKITTIVGENNIKNSQPSENLQIIHTKSSSNPDILDSSNSNSKDYYALDIGELGGMYAGKIHLVGTKEGLGVRSAGHIGAGAGDVVIDANGKITNSGVINAHNKITTIATKDITNTGKIEAKNGDITLKTKKNIQQIGSIIAQKASIKINANNNITHQGETVAGKNITYVAKNVNATTSSLIASGVILTPRKQEAQRQLKKQGENGSTLSIHTTENINLHGKNVSSGKFDITAQSINLNHSQNSGYDININAKQGDIQANLVKITAKNNLKINTIKNLSTQNSHLKAENISTKQLNLNSEKSIWQHTGNSDFILKANNINNTKGSFNIQGNFLITAQNLKNTKGFIASSHNQGVLNIAKTLENQSGEILSLGNLSILENLTSSNFANNLQINNNEGKIQANKNLKINAKSLSMNGYLMADNISLKLKDNVVTEKDISANSSLSIDTQGNIINSKKLLANNKIILNANFIENKVNGKISSGETHITANNKLINRGLINSFAKNNQAKTVLKAQDIINIGTGRIYGDYVALAGTSILNTDEKLNNIDKSAIIAARKRLDLAAETIVNDTTLYNSNKKGGSTIYSEGNIVFGAKLNKLDQVQGNAKSFKNKSSIVEALGSIDFHVDNVINSNEHYVSELQETSNIPVSKNYILPKDDATGNAPYNNGKLKYINTNKLYWASYSRAGKWVDNISKKEPIIVTKINQINPYNVLAEPNAVNCPNIDSTTNCTPMEAGIYNKDNPVWEYFNITPPQENQPEPPNVDIKDYLRKTGVDVNSLSDDELDALEENITAPIIPPRPTLPIKLANETDVNFQKRLTQYNHDKVKYDNAIELKNEFDKFKPTLDWMAKNGEKLQKLTEKITQHNSYIFGREYYNYWVIRVNRELVKESITIASLPGQILAGKNINYNTNNFLNDKSVVITGDVLKQTGLGRLENRDDEDAIRQDIELGGRWYSYTKWRGGVRRYHQRKSSSIGGLERINENHKDMNLFLTKEHSNPSVYKDYINAKQLNNIVKQANDVELYKTNKEFNIRSIAVDTRLPNQSLYNINPNPNSHFVIETDPNFTNYKKWLSSDYMFNALRYDHNRVLKRLGDGFYEQKLIQEQINRLTGRQFIGNNQNFEAQYKALMDNGITFANKFHLRPGILLSKEQVGQLTSDIVWLESQSITLPNGQVEKVLVPKVYVLARKGDISRNGSLISADKLQISTNEIINQGTIAGRTLAQFNANQLTNNGTLTAGKLTANINGNVKNIGGTIEADNALFLNIAGDLTHKSTTQTTNIKLDGFKRKQTNLDRKALLHVKGKDGKLHINANNINLTGADIINDGSGQNYISAQNNLNLTALEVGFDEKMGQGNHYRNEKVQDVVISHINTKGDTVLKAKNILSQGARLESESELSAIAKNNLVLNSATRTSDFTEYHHTKNSYIVGKSSHTSFNKKDQILKKGSQLSANKITLVAGNNIKAKGVQIVADNKLNIIAKNNVEVSEDVESIKQEHFSKKSKSGLMRSGGIGVALGKQKNTSESDHAKLYAQKSQIGSLYDGVNIIAGNNYKQSASTVTSVTKNVDIKAKQVDILAGDDKYETHSKYTFEQKGVTVAVNIPAVQAIQAGINTAENIEKIGDSKDDRINALAAANAAWDVIRTAESMVDAAKSTQALINGDLKNANISASITYGEQKNIQQSSAKGTIANSSKINAGGKVNVVAIGIKDKSDINIVGSYMSGKQGTALSADNINIKAKSQTHSERSDNHSKGVNAGVTVNYGSDGFAFGVTAGGNYGKGYGNGDELTWASSRVGDKNSKTSITSKNNTAIIGSRLQGEKVNITAKNLNIESLQDSMTYHGKQKGISAQATAGYGFTASGNFNKSEIGADYLSVTKQSGVLAGDDGFEVNITNHTDLKAGIITSSEKAQKSNKNSFTTRTISTSNLDNYSKYKAKGLAIGGGGSVSGSSLNQDKPKENSSLQNVANQNGVSKSVGYGSDSDNQNTTTVAGINTSNITITDKAGQQNIQPNSLNIESLNTTQTSDDVFANQGLLNNFDKGKVQKEVNTQVATTQRFDKARQELKAEIYKAADKSRNKAIAIRKETIIDGKNGYNTKESLALDEKADGLEQVAFYTDLALGGLYGWGNSDALTYIGVVTTTDPIVRAATIPAQIWEVKCKQDSLYCSNKSYDGESIRDVYGNKAEIGDKRQIFDINEIKPSETTGVITISNNGISNPRDDALKNAIKQNTWETDQDGVYVVYNRPTSNFVSELLYSAYDKTNDLVGGRLPMNSAEKTNIKLYNYAKQNNYQLDISSHSRGGLTSNISLQYANRNGLTKIPIRESRFLGTATHVQDYANQLVNKNQYKYIIKNNDGTTSEVSSVTKSAVHYTDFVGRSPLSLLRSKYIIGGNEPTGGIEDGWFVYSHGSYYGEVPGEYLKNDNGVDKLDSHGKKIRNPEYDKYVEKWGEPSKDDNGNWINQSLPKKVILDKK